MPHIACRDDKIRSWQSERQRLGGENDVNVQREGVCGRPPHPPKAGPKLSCMPKLGFRQLQISLGRSGDECVEKPQGPGILKPEQLTTNLICDNRRNTDAGVRSQMPLHPSPTLIRRPESGPIQQKPQRS